MGAQCGAGAPPGPSHVVSLPAFILGVAELFRIAGGGREFGFRSLLHVVLQLLGMAIVHVGVLGGTALVRVCVLGGAPPMHAVPLGFVATCNDAPGRIAAALGPGIVTDFPDRAGMSVRRRAGALSRGSFDVLVGAGLLH